MLNYTLIHGCDPDKYKPAEIVEILRPDPNLWDDCWLKEPGRLPRDESRKEKLRAFIK